MLTFAWSSMAKQAAVADIQGAVSCLFDSWPLRIRRFSMRTETMASSLDVAAYILKQKGAMTTWKLQKLVYYAQAWSIVWDDEAIFPEEIEAWANGPVVRELYDAHKGEYRISSLPDGCGCADALTDIQRETVDAVLECYGDKSPQWLSDLTHMESPWQLARRGVPVGERGNSEISKESLGEYYGSLSEYGE